MDRDELYEALRAAGLTGEQAVVAASVVRNLDPEVLAEAAGLTTHDRAVAAYEEGRQWGVKHTAEKIAEAIEAHFAVVGLPRSYGALSKAADIARSYAR